jgi:hypothetical protein
MGTQAFLRLRPVPAIGLAIGQGGRLLARDFGLQWPRIRSFLLLPSFCRPIYYHLPKTPFVELSR